MNVTQICAALLTLTEAELFVVDKELVTLIRHKQSVRQFEAGKKFTLGQRVKWQSKHGMEICGRVQKINVKSIKVVADNAMVWNVSPSLLEECA